MVIMTEQTPDPASLKFLPCRMAMGNGTACLANETAATRSPLVPRRFEITGVAEVFCGGDLIDLTRTVDQDRRPLEPPIPGAIFAPFTVGASLLVQGAERVGSEGEDEPEEGNDQGDAIVTPVEGHPRIRLRVVRHSIREVAEVR